ncbi:acyl-CoA reductase [Azorhizobium doebereinerae]|uniref:acyl-CoA reductase n=1 Tax=Azorhizobium doebereinerae TaxID=281091 RepID=UPI00041DB478|nr:acyl-CoA reductase [Azorhizobium doebereinerae]
MNRRHLWRGEWLAADLDTDLDTALAGLGDTLDTDLSATLDTGVLLRAADRLSAAIARRAHPELSEALAEAGYSAEQADRVLDRVAGFLSWDSLSAKLSRELGADDPAMLRRFDFSRPIFEGWAPLGVLMHVAAGNAPTVAPLSVVEGLLTGNINILKASSSDGPFAELLLKALVDAAPDGALKPFVYSLRIPSSDKARLTTVLNLADGVAAWGSEEAVNAIRALAPSSARIVEWGHKISFGYVTPAAAADPAVLAAMAHDVCLNEQQACASPQCLYLEVEDGEDVQAALNAFAGRFAAALGEVSGRTPARLVPGPQEQAEITTACELVRLGAVLGEGDIVEAPDGSWRLLLDYAAPLRASPLFRTLWIKPMVRARLVATLRPLRPYLQTCGLGCAAGELAALTSLLTKAGVYRVTPPGGMLDGYMGEPHDGVYALQRYSRRVCLRAPEPLVAGIAAFGDFVPAPPPGLLPHTPVLTKEAFQARPVPEKDAHLYFRSGGSSGAPKLSVFSHHDYDGQMSAAAEGLYATGLDPATDRVMNLFKAGYLYGGFVSFFSILERMKAVCFPMASIDELDQVVQAIADYKVDTLIGMPGYLIRLFREQGDALKAYGGVRKIFYGGEHFNEAQKDFLRRDFGVHTIRSAVYGSVDAGPLAYACPHCDGGVHHVMSRTQFLEILDLDGDRPVADGAVGRLVFTSRLRHGQGVDRYEIGDLGRWVAEPCPCGRAAPRFELMGRHGDVFRIGMKFLNYRKIANLLADHGGYAGELQAVLDWSGGKERIVLRVDEGSGLAPASVAPLLLERYPELREAVIKYHVLDLAVEPVAPGAFERIAGSGKLRMVIDRRQTA